MTRFFRFTISVSSTVAGLSQNWHLFMARPPAARKDRPSSLPLEVLDAVADAGGVLVLLLGDELLQRAAELRQFHLRALRPRQPARRFADVPGVVVDALQQRQEVVLEGVVVVRAPEAAEVAELHELQPAHLALLV